MIYIVKINNKEYEVEVEKGIAKITRTAVSPAVQPDIIEKAPAAPIHAPSNLSADVALYVGVEGNPVKAPMPGTILDIKVTPGKVVKKGDILLILEAMKMENEIIAPASGVIAQVFTTKGSAVSTGDMLLTIK